ncbi:neuronal acetylcholine receptor subunit alpha-7-like [Saccostrea cucullata]|uniref:neuronal acetylcholine receptor subunit alpha-7-like n=1 Tax=Saccostrea cuccullata TaxID=36930 RepID=UPI002ECFD729
MDEILRWNSSQNGVYYMYLPRDSTWTPQIVLLNSATEVLGIDTGNQIEESIILASNGKVLYTVNGLAITKCYADIFYYPFDQHDCTLDILSPLDKEHMVLKSIEFDFYFLPTNSKEWTIIDILKENTTHKFSAVFDHNRVIFTVRFKRKPEFLILNILIPIIALGLTNPLVFVLPESSGERVSLAVTNLLTMVFFLNLVADSLPRSSDPISMLNISIMIQIGNSIFILIFTILTIIISDKTVKNDPVPNALKNLLMRIAIRKIKKNAVGSEGCEMENQTLGRCGKSISGEGDHENSTGKEKAKTPDWITWEYISNMTNKACLRMFLLLIIGNWLSYVIFICWPSIVK